MDPSTATKSAQSSGHSHPPKKYTNCADVTPSVLSPEVSRFSIDAKLSDREIVILQLSAQVGALTNQMRLLREEMKILSDTIRGSRPGQVPPQSPAPYPSYRPPIPTTGPIGRNQYNPPVTVPNAPAGSPNF